MPNQHAAAAAFSRLPKLGDVARETATPPFADPRVGVVASTVRRGVTVIATDDTCVSLAPRVSLDAIAPSGTRHASTPTTDSAWNAGVSVKTTAEETCTEIAVTKEVFPPKKPRHSTNPAACALAPAKRTTSPRPASTTAGNPVARKGASCLEI